MIKTVTPTAESSIPLGATPCEGGYVIRIPLVFDGSGDDLIVDLSAIQSTGHFSAAQTLFVNNLNNAAVVTCTMNQSYQQFAVPIGGFMYMPMLQPNPPKITFNCTQAITVYAHIVNFFLPPVIWGPTLNGAAITLGNTGYYLPGLTTASTNATNVKASAGILYNVTVINPTATLCYIRFYNLSGVPNPASAVGAHSPNIPIPANVAGAGVTVNFGPNGMAFNAGIGFVVTGGGADTDATNAPAGVAVNLLYS